VTEEEFRELLISSLQKCRDGSTGVFLAAAKASRLGDVYPRLVWPEARRLESLGEKIKSLREQLGEPTEGSLCAKYRQYCSRDGANDPGGARLAAEFLADIERDERTGFRSPKSDHQ